MPEKENGPTDNRWGRFFDRSLGGAAVGGVGRLWSWNAAHVAKFSLHAGFEVLNHLGDVGLVLFCLLFRLEKDDWLLVIMVKKELHR
jgi:hypothetical protein